MNIPVAWFQQWQFWVAALNLIGLVAIFLFNKFSHDKLVSNDLQHLSVDLKTVITKQDALGKQVVGLAEDVAYLKGKMDIPQRTTRKSLRKTSK